MRRIVTHATHLTHDAPGATSNVSVQVSVSAVSATSCEATVAANVAMGDAVEELSAKGNAIGGARPAFKLRNSAHAPCHSHDANVLRSIPAQSPVCYMIVT